MTALDATRNPWIKPFVIVALETAMRRGELLSLGWEHVDLTQRTAHLPETKNGKGRTAPFSNQYVKHYLNFHGKLVATCSRYP